MNSQLSGSGAIPLGDFSVCSLGSSGTQGLRWAAPCGGRFHGPWVASPGNRITSGETQTWGTCVVRIVSLSTRKDSVIPNSCHNFEHVPSGKLT